ncbi:MAG: hypothetical protein FWG64_12015 [Firmicutes bacterium]|nr:hypothetical protein [Bacillota bacterium]
MDSFLSTNNKNSVASKKVVFMNWLIDGSTLHSLDSKIIVSCIDRVSKYALDKKFCTSLFWELDSSEEFQPIYDKLLESKLFRFTKSELYNTFKTVGLIYIKFLTEQKNAPKVEAPKFTPRKISEADVLRHKIKKMQPTSQIWEKAENIEQSEQIVQSEQAEDLLQAEQTGQKEQAEEKPTELIKLNELVELVEKAELVEKVKKVEKVEKAELPKIAKKIPKQIPKKIPSQVYSDTDIKTFTEATLEQIILEYCKISEHFTLDELLAYEQERTGEIHTRRMAELAAAMLIRTDKTVYIIDSLLHFDCAFIDYEIKKFILTTAHNKRYLLLKAFDNFENFPECGKPWNLFLLESYCRRFSKMFCIKEQAINSNNLGVVAFCDSNLDYIDIMADAVFEKNVPLQASEVNKFLFKSGYIKKPKTSSVEDIIMRARKLHG